MMNTLKLLTLILSVMTFTVSASAQKVQSTQKSWSSSEDSTGSIDLEDAELNDSDGDLEAEELATEDLEDLSAIDDLDDKDFDGEELEDIDALLDDDDKDTKVSQKSKDDTAKDEDKDQYEVVETKYVNGKPVRATKRVSKSELQDIIGNKSKSESITTTTTTKATPRRKIIRRVLKRKKRPSTNVTTALVSAPLPTKSKPKRFHLTPIIGATYGQIEGSFLTSRFSNIIESDFGLTGGLLAEFHKEGSIFGVETGIIYSQTSVIGNNNLLTLNSSSLDFMTNEYLMFPLAAKIYPIRKERFNLYIKAGVAGGALLNSTFRQNNNTTIANLTSDSSSFFKESEFQWLAGAGARIQLSKDIAFSIDSYYFRSFNNIIDNDNAFVLLGSTGGDARIVGVNTTAGLVIDL